MHVRNGDACRASALAGYDTPLELSWKAADTAVLAMRVNANLCATMATLIAMDTGTVARASSAARARAAADGMHGRAQA